MNYTQFSPLAEPYISIFPRKDKATSDEDVEADEDEAEAEDSENKSEEKEITRPPMWSEVEKAMADSTLNKLRNRAPVLPPKPARAIPKQVAPVKTNPKPVPTAAKVAQDIDTSGLNRRERRKLLRGEEPATRTRTKIKSMSAGFEKNMAFGAAQAVVNKNKAYQKDEEDSDDGGFFE